MQNLMKYSAKRTSEPVSDIVAVPEIVDKHNVSGNSSGGASGGVVATPGAPAAASAEVQVGHAGAASGPHEPPAEEDCS